jgi:hypothetical protein
MTAGVRSEHEEIMRRARQIQRQFIKDFAAAAARVRAGTIRRNRHGRELEKRRTTSMGKLVKVDNQYVDQLREEVAELGGNDFGTLLKFDWDRKKFVVGKDEVALGREFIAHCDQYARGWVKFVDKAPVDVQVKKVGEGKPKERNELDEPELADTDEDPWVYQRYLPLEDPETGEILVFVSKSVGGKIALSDLLGIFERNWDRGRPIVKLDVSSFKTKEFGMKQRPSFPVVGWTGSGQKVAAVAPNDPGPPDSDPDDPGYDLLGNLR